MPKRPVHNKSRGPRRIVHARTAGIANRDAAYWKGERAETSVEQRRAGLAAEKAAKQAARKPRSTVRDASGKRVRTPSAQLKRLERALLRRKTLAGRQSVERAIKQLKRDHAL